MKINLRVLSRKNILKLSIFLWSFISANFARADMIDPGWKPRIPMDTAPGVTENNLAENFTHMFFIRASLGLVVVIICLAVSLLIVSKIKKKK